GHAGHAARPGPAGTGTAGGVRAHRSGVARFHARSPPRLTTLLAPDPPCCVNRFIRYFLRRFVLVKSQDIADSCAGVSTERADGRIGPPTSYDWPLPPPSIPSKTLR